MRPLALSVLALVFLDELLCMAGLGIAGWHASPRWLWVVVWPVAGMLVWFFFCSPKARHGGPVVRPIVKVLVFGAACLGLWWAGHPTLAWGLLVFSVIINGVAQLPFVRDTQTELL